MTNIPNDLPKIEVVCGRNRSWWSAEARRGFNDTAQEWKVVARARSKPELEDALASWLKAQGGNVAVVSWFDC